MNTVCGRRVLGSTRLIRALLGSLQLNRPTKLCYLLMCAYARDSGQCYASEATLAKDLGSSPDQVRRYLHQLTRAGLIHPQPVAGKPTRYTFLWHPAYAEASGPPLASMPPPPLASVSLPPGMDARVCIGSKEGRSNQQCKSSSVQAAGRRGTPPPGGKTTTTTLELEKDVRAEIWGYFQGERRVRVDPPDRGIVRQCVAALHGHSIEEARVLLRERFRSGFRPGQAGGPRGYPWFVRVFENAFGPRE